MNPCLAPLRFLVLLLATAGFTHADVRLHGLFTDQMVLQRDAAVSVWGWADDGERVTVQFRDQTVTTTAVHGKWIVALKNLKAGGPDDLKVSGKNSLTLHDVVVGEVWIASGQSNMEMAMRSTFDATNEIATTGNPLIRFYTVSKLKADQPVENVSNTDTAPIVQLELLFCNRTFRGQFLVIDQEWSILGRNILNAVALLPKWARIGMGCL